MRFQKLDCYIAAKELARLVHEAGIAHPVLRDQACRSSVSCFLQLAEGLPNEGEGMRRKYFTSPTIPCTRQSRRHWTRRRRSEPCPPTGLQPFRTWRSASRKC